MSDDKVRGTKVDIIHHRDRTDEHNVTSAILGRHAVAIDGQTDAALHGWYADVFLDLILGTLQAYAVASTYTHIQDGLFEDRVAVTILHAEDVLT